MLNIFKMLFICVDNEKKSSRRCDIPVENTELLSKNEDFFLNPAHHPLKNASHGPRNN